MDEQSLDQGQLAALFKFQNISLGSVSRYEGKYYCWYSETCLICQALGEKFCVRIDEVSDYTVEKQIYIPTNAKENNDLSWIVMQWTSSTQNYISIKQQKFDNLQAIVPLD